MSGDLQGGDLAGLGALASGHGTADDGLRGWAGALRKPDSLLRRAWTGPIALRQAAGPRVRTA
jgi:hypothetical protein